MCAMNVVAAHVQIISSLCHYDATRVHRHVCRQMNLPLRLCSWQVDIKNQGKTALQVAAHQGHMEVVKALLQANGSVEVKDEDGDTALHYTAFG